MCTYFINNNAPPEIKTIELVFSSMGYSSDKVFGVIEKNIRKKTSDILLIMTYILIYLMREENWALEKTQDFSIIS